MSVYNKFNQFVGDLANGKHNFGSDTFKVLLTNVAPVATNSIKSDITEISAGSGYSAGGVTLATTSDTDTSGTVKFVASADNVITASGTVGPFRYAVLYNDTQSSPVKPLIAWWDRGTSITLASGDTFTIDTDQTNGIFQLS
jgi:hypothetical protein